MAHEKALEALAAAGVFLSCPGTRGCGCPGTCDDTMADRLDAAGIR